MRNKHADQKLHLYDNLSQLPMGGYKIRKSAKNEDLELEIKPTVFWQI